MLFLLPPPLAILKYSTIRPWHRLKNPGLGPLLASRKDSEVKTSSSWRSRSDGSWPNFLMIFQWFWCCLSDSWCFLLSVFLFLRTNFDDFWMFAHDFCWLCMFFWLFWMIFGWLLDDFGRVFGRLLMSFDWCVRWFFDYFLHQPFLWGFIFVALLGLLQLQLSSLNKI